VKGGQQFAKTYLIYKSKHGVCLSVCGDKQGRGRARAGQGRAGRPGQTPAHSRSFSVTPGKATVVVSICVGSA